MSIDSIGKRVRYKSLAFMHFSKYRVGDDGSIWSKCWYDEWIQLRRNPTKGKYVQVSLSRDDGKRCNFLVHELVLYAFIGPRPDGKEACHFPDREKTNNHLSNLRWGTPTENYYDAITHGTANMGERHGGAKLTVAKVQRIRKLCATGKYTQMELGEMFNIHYTNISLVVRRKWWKHVL